MTARDGKPCKRCGTAEWYDRNGCCKQCKRDRAKANEPNRKGKRKRRYTPEQLERQREWYKNNIDKERERARQKYSHEHNQSARYVESVRAAGRRYAKNHPEKFAAKNNIRRTRKTAAGGSYTVQEWKDLCNYYENKCLCCGRDDMKLTADHVIPVAMGGSSDISNIQPLCKPCNSRKNNRRIDYRNRGSAMRWIQKKLFGGND